MGSQNALWYMIYFGSVLFFLIIYLQHAPLHYYAILRVHACFILYIYVISITFIHLVVTVPFITYQSLLSLWIEQSTLCIYSLVHISPSARFLVLLCFLLELLSPSVTLGTRISGDPLFGCLLRTCTQKSLLFCMYVCLYVCMYVCMYVQTEWICLHTQNIIYCYNESSVDPVHDRWLNMEHWWNAVGQKTEVLSEKSAHFVLRKIKSDCPCTPSPRLETLCQVTGS